MQNLRHLIVMPGITVIWQQTEPAHVRAVQIIALPEQVLDRVQEHIGQHAAITAYIYAFIIMIVVVKLLVVVLRVAAVVKDLLVIQNRIGVAGFPEDTVALWLLRADFAKSRR